MVPEDYAGMVAAYDAQKWFLPIYLNIIFVIPLIGFVFFFFVAYLIIWKTPKLNGYFRWGLVESIVFPELLSLHIGLIFKPYLIIPFEIFWSYGYFTTSEDTWYQLFITACLACFYIFSLLFLSYIYIKAFIGKGLLHISKYLKIAFLVGATCCSGSGVLVFHTSNSSLETKQKKDQATVLAGDQNNIFFFTELGGYIMNIQGSTTLQYVLYGSVLFWATAAIIIGCIIILRIIIILYERKSEVSIATAKLQKTFIIIILTHITIFVSFYGFPVTLICLLLSWKMPFLSNYPLFPLVIIQFTFLPIVYSLVNLFLVKQVRDAFLTAVGCKKRKINDSFASSVSSKTTAISSRRSTLILRRNTLVNNLSNRRQTL